jgi:hypothetical protein
MMTSIRCDMDRACEAEPTHIDHKGYVYCTRCNEARKAGEIRTRKLRTGELAKLETGQSIRY